MDYIKNRKFYIIFSQIISYLYIISSFFSSKINMKIGYVLLLLAFIFTFYLKSFGKKVKINFRVYIWFFIILILGSIWNYISSDFIGMKKFFNIGSIFIYGIALLPFLYESNKNIFNISIFLSTNLLGGIFLLSEGYAYVLVDDLGRFRIIFLIGWVYILVYTLEKILKDLKKYGFLILFSLIPFIVLEKTGTRMGALGLGIILFSYFLFKIFSNKKYLKEILVTSIIFCLFSFLLPKEYISRLQTSFKTTSNISNEDRIVMWKAGVNIIKEHIIFGVGSYDKKIYPYVQKYVRENIQDEILRNEFLNEPRFAKLHNMYIDFFVQNGILGFLYLLLLLVIIPYEFIKSKKNEESIAAFFTLMFYSFYGLTWSLWSGIGISQVLFQIFLIWMLINLENFKRV